MNTSLYLIGAFGVLLLIIYVYSDNTEMITSVDKNGNEVVKSKVWTNIFIFSTILFVVFWPLTLLYLVVGLVVKDYIDSQNKSDNSQN